MQGQETEAELVGEFVREYYARAVDLPTVVLLAAEIADAGLVAASLSARLERKVALRAPKRGPRRRLLDMATNNARESLEIEHRSRMGSRRRLRRALSQIGEALGLRRLPRRIECFDISHLQGAHVVGAMVVFEDGMPQKKPIP